MQLISLNGFWMSVGGYLYVARLLHLTIFLTSLVVQHKSTIAPEILVLQLPLYGLSEICL